MYCLSRVLPLSTFFLPSLSLPLCCVLARSLALSRALVLIRSCVPSRSRSRSLSLSRSCSLALALSLALSLAHFLTHALSLLLPRTRATLTFSLSFSPICSLRQSISRPPARSLFLVTSFLPSPALFVARSIALALTLPCFHALFSVSLSFPRARAHSPSPCLSPLCARQVLSSNISVNLQLSTRSAHPTTGAIRTNLSTTSITTSNSSCTSTAASSTTLAPSCSTVAATSNIIVSTPVHSDAGVGGVCGEDISARLATSRVAMSLNKVCVFVCVHACVRMCVCVHMCV